MQPDVSTTRTAGEGRVAGEREPGYISERAAGIGQQVGSILQRPTVIGSMIVAILGAIVGIRVAQVQAEQRRRRFYDRWMETLGSLGAIALTAMRIRRRRMMMQQMLQARGQDITETTRGWGGMVMGRARMRAAGPRSTAQQVGYALSLIPLTMAFLRNPLVRDVGTRMLSRRETRGIGRNLLRR